MATNPQTDFDDDDWENQWVAPDMANATASIASGMANVRKFTPRTNEAGSPGGGQLGLQTNQSQRAAYTRGRGHLRRNDDTPTNSELRPAPNQPSFGRPIIGRSPEAAPFQSTDVSHSIFYLRNIRGALPDASANASGDGPDGSNQMHPPSNFSFRGAAEQISEQQFGNWEATPPPEVADNAEQSRVDNQVSNLERVLLQTSAPSGEDHERKLACLRQDPNHPLYSVTTFESMDLKVELKQGLSANRKYKLSAIQEKTLPALNNNPYRNCIAQSQNGTGKTVAFVITMLNRVDFSKPFVQALCLLPTKELAQQVVDTTKVLGKFFTGIDSLVFAALRDSTHQRTMHRLNEAELNAEGKLRAPIVIGTAGTVNSLMRKTKTLDCAGIIVFVVDEADKMLEHQSENFLTTIDNVTRRLSDRAQRIFFSATFSDEVRDKAKTFMSDPLVISLRDEDLSLDNIRHFYMRVRNREDKLSAMKKIYNAMTVGQSIVFCRTRAMSHWLSTELRQQLDFKVAELSGDMDPAERDSQISRFRRSADRVLVTTNVSARGLDISSVNLVINWDPPIKHDTKMADFDTYLHRVGRSGRFGADGIAVNMVEREEDLKVFRAIERHFGITVKPLSEVYDELEKTIGNRE